MPKCSSQDVDLTRLLQLGCFMQELPKSTCATNLTSECLCSNDALNAAVAVCAQKVCTVYELLPIKHPRVQKLTAVIETKNVSNKGCGVPDRYKGEKFIAVGVTGSAIAVLAFILRMLASVGKKGRQISWDDLTMGIVVLLNIPPAVFTYFLVQNGLGRDIWTLTDVQITNVLKFYYMGEIFYVVALGISKISILFFYLRVFPAKSFRVLTYSVMGVAAAYTVAFFFATTIQCWPISLAWTQWDGLHKGTCNNIHLQGWIAAAINIALDVVVMILPMKHLAALNMSLKKKIMVMSMFSVGIFVIFVSTIRLYSLIHFASTQNITWNYVDAGIWSLLEINVSIICGCMPAHRLLIVKLWPKMRSHVASSMGMTSKKSNLNSNSNATDFQLPSEKVISRISVKPKGRDNDTFIPLVDIDSNSDRARLTHEAGSPTNPRESQGWITQTHTVEIVTRNASVAEGSTGSNDWPTTDKLTIGKEHPLIMKFSFAILTTTLLSGNALVNAFPALDARNLAGLTPERLSAALRKVDELRHSKRLLVDVRKPISVTGNHAFQPPSRVDERGPCPGLNALANHGYISRNGITSFAEVVTAINQVMGMGLELSLILGIMGTVWTGNPLSLDPGFSIGAPPTGLEGENILGNVLGLVGKPRGLHGAHNWLESDASLTRNDYYLTGNAWTMNMTLFREFHDRADENGVLSMDLLADQAARRWHDSVANNGDFYYGPITGMVSRNAGIFFLGRLLSNHTSEQPAGVLTQDIFRKFFAVYEKADGSLEYREGHETIPNNWYRTPVEYGLIPLNLDIVSWIMKHPELGRYVGFLSPFLSNQVNDSNPLLSSIGGNTGTPNSFTGLDLSDITGGVLNSATLLEKNNLLCLVFELLKTFLPNSLSPLIKTVEVPVNMVTNILAAPLLSLACPAWRDLTEGGEPLWDGIQDKFPGARRAGSSL
ncbi:oxidase [Pyrenophora seminiperda CCB06]|uniref:Oxidase n=1 Tax=Pyrenophora seminiperda CCB06 TaxID=1302712 RepID=A0A3M7LVP3_9PLEO|nr:oxidase [Pyrenophora seminiperda CCB06]